MRRIRVYDPKDGDFIIDVPDDAKVTFGYFNPAAAGQKDPNSNMYGHANIAKQTALRIYEGKTEKSNQLACFIGVTGFRDESVGLTKLKEEIKIIREYEDDGEGNIVDNVRRNGKMKAIAEVTGYN